MLRVESFNNNYGDNNKKEVTQNNNNQKEPSIFITKNENGRIEETCTEDSDGNLISRIIYSYDSNDKVKNFIQETSEWTNEVTYNENGTHTSIVKDEMNNELVVITFDAKTGEIIKTDLKTYKKDD